jgi:hypothetical protein
MSIDTASPPGNLETARKAVEDTAAVGGGLWLSYLFVLFYLAIAAGAVTHADLLLQNPVKLPFLNIELPLLAFFFLAPLLFLLTHAYTLVHLVLLANRVAQFNDELRASAEDHAFGATAFRATSSCSSSPRRKRAATALSASSSRRSSG